MTKFGKSIIGTKYAYYAGRVRCLDFGDLGNNLIKNRRKEKNGNKLKDKRSKLGRRAGKRERYFGGGVTA